MKKSPRPERRPRRQVILECGHFVSLTYPPKLGAAVTCGVCLKPTVVTGRVGFFAYCLQCEYEHSCHGERDSYAQAQSHAAIEKHHVRVIGTDLSVLELDSSAKTSQHMLEWETNQQTE